jgi:hypothetical protein
VLQTGTVNSTIGTANPCFTQSCFFLLVCSFIQIELMFLFIIPYLQLSQLHTIDVYNFFSQVNPKCARSIIKPCNQTLKFVQGQLRTSILFHSIFHIICLSLWYFLVYLIECMLHSFNLLCGLIVLLFNFILIHLQCDIFFITFTN